MAKTTYRDLATFGLPLVTPTQPTFASLLRDIERQHEARKPWSEPWPIDDLNNAAVLLNESGDVVLGVSYFWRYTTATGSVCTKHCSNFLGTSSRQLEVLTGRSKALSDLGTFILPGSKRLITEGGMFGNNLDVLGQEGVHGGCVGAGCWGRRLDGKEEVVSVELALDLAILEDSRCVGPDEMGFFDFLITGLEEIRRTSQEAAMMVRSGTSMGEVVEMLRRLVTHRTPQRTRVPPFVHLFSHMGIDKLAGSDFPRVASWFETQAQSRLNLYRAS